MRAQSAFSIILQLGSRKPGHPRLTTARSRERGRRGRWRVAAVSVCALVAGLLAPTQAGAAPTNLALNALATATSSENAGLGPDKAVDGDTATRWSSAFSDPQSLTVDLGAPADLSGIVLRWEAAHATAYEIALSADGEQWETAVSVTDGDGGVDELDPGVANARYVRLTGTARATEYGYSLYEIEVLGEFTGHAVSLGRSTAELAEGGTVELPVRLNMPADTEVTVGYATADGSAVAGSDYQAASGTVTFPPGETERTITLTALDDDVDEQSETFTVTLGEVNPASVGVGPRGSATVRITDDDSTPYDGATRVIADFESGVPATLFTFGSDADDNPTLAAEAAERPGVTDNHALRVSYDISGYGGLVQNLAEAQDWQGFDGISFWFKGSATGQRLQFEVKDGGPDADNAELWEAFFTDDSTGWQLVRIRFADLVKRTSYQPPGAPTDGVLDRTQMWGYAFNLPTAAGSFLLDQVEAYQQVLVIDSFEGDVPFGSPAGIFTFGADDDDHPVLTVEERAREGAPAGNHALRVAYGADEGGWGGLAHNLTYDSDPADWSAFGGFRFWFFGTNEAPLPPGSGPRINLEIKDGGANAEASELWTTSFTDDFAGWQLIEIPFSEFVFRTDYQPVGGINQELDLTAMWGYAFTPPTGREGVFALDDIQVYGVATPPSAAVVNTVKPVYPVDEGGPVTVGVTLTTPDGEPLAEAVTVDYRTEGGSATADADYSPVAGEITFEPGTESGAVQTFSVDTATDDQAEVAETVEVAFASADAELSADLPATIVINAHGLPYLDASLPIEQRVTDLLGRMSLADKVGQMTQAERAALDSQDDLAQWRIGSLLSGGGSVPTPNTPAAWADMVDGYQLRTMQTPLQIPLIYGVDAVHGHNNVVGATIFPHNIGLGATRDPALVRRVGAVTATEVRATGVSWDFSPCLCVARDERWGRTYESFGEDPALVAAMATLVAGLQGDDLSANTSVLATLKHWVGDGGTGYGTSTTGSYTVDQGVTVLSRADLERLHIAPYSAGLRYGAGSVMPSYSSVDTGSGPVKMHAHKELITDVLKGRLGFNGFVISDWQAIDQIPGDYRSDIRTSIDAGLDMIMVPHEYQRFGTLLTEIVNAGELPMERIDDAVRRILRQKFALGLFENPYADRTNLSDVGTAAHRAVAREAAARSQVLLKNSRRMLPLARDAKLYVAGSNADDLGNQAGGWTISWQGASGATTEGTTILGGIREVLDEAPTVSRDASADLAGHDAGVVVVGETPYAEGIGDVGNGRADLSLSAADRQAIDRVCGAMPCVVVIVSGRPMILDPAQLAEIDAVVAAWLPGSEGAGVADTLFGLRPYTGRLPATWARTMAQLPINVGDAAYDPLYPYGWGLRTDRARQRLAGARDELAALVRPATVRDEAGRHANRDHHLAVAVKALDKALARKAWRADGSVKDERWVLGWLRVATEALRRSPADTGVQADAVVSVARDVAQARIVAKAAAKPTSAEAAAAEAAAAKVTAARGLTADAEHQLLSGRPDRAVELLTRAWQLLR